MSNSDKFASFQKAPLSDDYVVEVSKTKYGPIYCFKNDTGVSECLRQFGEYGESEIKFYKSLLQSGDCFVDIGCNIGTISNGIIFNEDTYRVFAFEPQLEYFKLANLNIPHSQKVHLFPYAVSNFNGIGKIPEIKLQAKGNYGSISISQKSDRSLPAPFVRLDDFLKTRSPKPRIIKIDVEGMELDVLEGCRNILHNEIIFSIEADRPHSTISVYRLLEELGFNCYLFFFAIVSRECAQFDENHPLCRVFSPHIIGLFDEHNVNFKNIYSQFYIESEDDLKSRLSMKK